MKAALYYHTLRYLEPSQILGRVKYRAAKPGIDRSPAPPRRDALPRWQTPPARTQSLLEPGKFELLGTTGRVDCPADWQSTHHDKLWLYHLHYFDDLNADHAGERGEWHLALVDRWIIDNPPGRGVGWEAYPVSLRIVNWIKWMLRDRGMAERDRLDSLAVQARWLSRRIEYHLRANHLFVNAKALVFAGAFFDGPEAANWFALGVSILERELPEQVLDDGGQFERSPMYHALAYEDVLDILNLARTFPSAFEGNDELITNCTDAAERMGRWLAVMCHPDGEVSFFNDAAIGIAPTPASLFDYARQLGVTPGAANGRFVHLPDSGYVRLAIDEAVALLDVAPVGPDYQPGHAHADTLSFELSVRGQRVVVNSGTSLYGTGPERQRQRGTAAHSTVCVDDKDSSEVWSGFRVARRARPCDLDGRDTGDEVFVLCRHDGYRRLPGRPVHTRTWRMGQGSLRVVDEVSGRTTRAVARFHLHPQVSVSEISRGRFRLDAPGLGSVRLETAGGVAHVRATTYHPRFGASMANRCIEIPLDRGRCETTIDWA